MAERTEPIRQDIEATRASMTETLEQIEGQVRDKVDTTVAQAREALDLRQHVEKRPWLSLGAASLLGYLVGAMGGDDDMPAPPAPGQPMRYYAQPASSQPSHVSSEERHSSTNGHSHGGQHSGSGRPSQFAGAVAQVADPIREELSVMAMAAVRSAMRVLRETLQDSIPQFDTEYRNVQRERGEGDDSSRVGTATYGSRMDGVTSQPEAGSFGSRPGTTSSL